MDKRRREQARKQKKMDKEHRRVQRVADKQAKKGQSVGKDADLEGLVPGPQPGQIIGDSEETIDDSDKTSSSLSRQ
jgi:hypothetical protein